MSGTAVKEGAFFSGRLTIVIAPCADSEKYSGCYALSAG